MLYLISQWLWEELIRFGLALKTGNRMNTSAAWLHRSLTLWVWFSTLSQTFLLRKSETLVKSATICCSTRVDIDGNSLQTEISYRWYEEQVSVYWTHLRFCGVKKMYSVRPSLIMIGEILALRLYLHYNFHVVVVLPKYPKNINVTWHADIKM